VTVLHRGVHEAALPDVRHVHDERAGYPVIAFPAELRAERFDVVVQMVPMGERDAAAAVDRWRCSRSRTISRDTCA
jgi:hypothetical protein